MRVFRYHAGFFPTGSGLVAVLLDDPAYTAHASNTQVPNVDWPSCCSWPSKKPLDVSV